MKTTRQVGEFKIKIGTERRTGNLSYRVYQDSSLVTTYVKGYWESGRDALKNAIAKAQNA